jgi:hypothetical protein
MSGLNPIRKLTDTDTARLEAAALRFAARHGFRIDPDWTGMWSAYEGMECELRADNQPATIRLRRLWRACFCRALGFKPSADLTINYGYVGTRCN